MMLPYDGTPESRALVLSRAEQAKAEMVESGWSGVAVDIWFNKADAEVEITGEMK